MNKLFPLVTLTFLTLSCSHTSKENSCAQSMKTLNKEKSSSCTECSKPSDCSHSEADKYLKLIDPSTKIGNLASPTYKHMSFSGAPTRENLVQAQKLGYKTFINLQSPSETTWDIKSEAQKLGLNYYNVPLLNSKKEIDPQAIKQLEDLHHKTHQEKQLVFCTTGNRAAAWMSAHLMVKHKLPSAEAIKVGRQLGLTKKETEEKLEHFSKTLL